MCRRAPRSQRLERRDVRLPEVRGRHRGARGRRHGSQARAGRSALPVGSAELLIVCCFGQNRVVLMKVGQSGSPTCRMGTLSGGGAAFLIWLPAVFTNPAASVKVLVFVLVSTTSGSYR